VNPVGEFAISPRKAFVGHHAEGPVNVAVVSEAFWAMVRQKGCNLPKGHIGQVVVQWEECSKKGTLSRVAAAEVKSGSAKRTWFRSLIVKTNLTMLENQYFLVVLLDNTCCNSKLVCKSHGADQIVCLVGDLIKLRVNLSVNYETGAGRMTAMGAVSSLAGPVITPSNNSGAPCENVSIGAGSTISPILLDLCSTRIRPFSRVKDTKFPGLTASVVRM